MEIVENDNKTLTHHVTEDKTAEDKRFDNMEAIYWIRSLITEFLHSKSDSTTDTIMVLKCMYANESSS